MPIAGADGEIDFLDAGIRKLFVPVQIVDKLLNIIPRNLIEPHFTQLGENVIANGAFQAVIAERLQFLILIGFQPVIKVSRQGVMDGGRLGFLALRLFEIPQFLFDSRFGLGAETFGERLAIGRFTRLPT